MCLALLDRRAWTAGELARHAGIGRSTASEHLTHLVGAGLLAEERQGRHRYVRLADAQVAQLVEDLASLTGEPARPTSLRAVRAGHRLAAARTCYDHLAGALGVTLFGALVRTELLSVDDGLALTPSGRRWFTDLAGDAALLPRGSRPLLRTCLDWTERTHHLGGTLGQVLCQQCTQRSWITRTDADRSVSVTPAGSQAFAQLLGVALPVK
jgi:DNA-binding transcriptional ArsR family regulator